MGGALKKGVHTQLMCDTHNAFRVELFKRDLSMQETFEAFVQAILSREPWAARFLDEVQRKKREGLLKQLISKTDKQSVYETINLQSPFREETDDENA